LLFSGAVAGIVAVVAVLSSDVDMFILLSNEQPCGSQVFVCCYLCCFRSPLSQEAQE
jgi:hypothetical protein